MHPKDVEELTRDIKLNSTMAAYETLRSNTTRDVITGAALWALSYNMVKHNIVPMAMAATSFACGLFTSAPLYRVINNGIKGFVRNPFGGFKNKD
jgi:hypothetical protein